MAKTEYSGNSVEVAAGAVFLSGAGLGPTFRGVRFVSNSAPVGGGSYVAGSGNAEVRFDGIARLDPTTLDGCTFIGNKATATGGATESASGRDVIVNTAFVGNTEGEQGTLKLPGLTSLSNCYFVDICFGRGGGGSRVQYRTSRESRTVLFVGSVFTCQPNTFLDFDEVSCRSSKCTLGQADVHFV